MGATPLKEHNTYHSSSHSLDSNPHRVAVLPGKKINNHCYRC